MDIYIFHMDILLGIIDDSQSWVDKVIDSDPH